MPAVNVTPRYARANPAKPDHTVVHLRLRDKPGGKRLVADIALLDADGKLLQLVTTKAGTADMNDMPSLNVRTGVPYRLRVHHLGEARAHPLEIADPGEHTTDLAWSELSPAG